MYYFKIFPYTNAAANINYKTDGVVPSISAATAATPQLMVIPASLSGFTYNAGSGPSASQSYLLSGAALTPASGTITVTATGAYEVSTNNSSFTNSVNVNYSSSALSSTLIYVRLKAGLVSGNYTVQTIANAGGGSSTVDVSCSGSVSANLAEPTNYPTNFSSNNILLQWTDATGGVQPNGYLVRMSSIGFSSIDAPVDGVTYSAAGDLYVPFGQEYAWIKNLLPNTTYYFKLYAYGNSGSSIDYKIDGSVPQVQMSTAP
jgi:hypothetical protein